MSTYLRASMTGTMSITNSVFLGLSPTAVNPAYDSAPNTPAAPVPDDQVDTVFL